MSAFATLAETMDMPVLGDAQSVDGRGERLGKTHDPLSSLPTASRRALSLAQHVQEVLNHLVAAGDHPRIGRIGLLRHDQLGELVGDVGIGAFERGAYDIARAP